MLIGLLLSVGLVVGIGVWDVRSHGRLSSGAFVSACLGLTFVLCVAIARWT
jgi:hypothetical protein